MNRLPDLRIHRFLWAWRIERYVQKFVARISHAEDLCVVQIATKARLTEDMKRAGFTRQQAAKRSLENAVVALNRATQPYGWTFYLPYREQDGSLYIDGVVPSGEMLPRLEELLKEVRRARDMEDHSFWTDVYETHGASRASRFESDLSHPSALIVGIRNPVKPAREELRGATA